MKKMLLTVLFVLPLAGFALAADGKKDEAKGKALEFTHHDRGHFEKNNSGLKGDASFLIFTNRDDFDKIFGVGVVMGGKEKLVPKDAFDTKVVAAVIKRGAGITKYEVEKVTNDDGTIYVQYKAETKEGGGTAKLSSPLIVSLDKGKYKEVVFIENGKKTETVKFEKEKDKDK
jgi:hypothetical protein